MSDLSGRMRWRSLSCGTVVVLLVAWLRQQRLRVLLWDGLPGRIYDLLPGWRPNDMPDLTGKVAIVTGPTIGGVGFEACVELAKKNAHVILAGRSEVKGLEALKELQQRVPLASSEFLQLDLANLSSVKAFATRFKAKFTSLHVLMNSAGIMATPFSLTVDGLESQFATNHLGHFLLTKLLLPHLQKSAPSRIVTVSSSAAFIPDLLSKLEVVKLADATPTLDFESVGKDYEHRYEPFKAYARSKLANVLFTRALARRLQHTQVYANSCHPGLIMSNMGHQISGKIFKYLGSLATSLSASLTRVANSMLMTPASGAVTQLYLATALDVESEDIRGQFFWPQASQVSGPEDPALEEKLWTVSEQLVARYI